MASLRSFLAEVALLALSTFLVYLWIGLPRPCGS